MSRLHATLVAAYGLVFFVGPGALALTVDPSYSLAWILSVFIGFFIVTACADEGFYVLPITFELRAENRRSAARREAKELNRKRSECLRLAEVYRNREEPYQATVLEAEASACLRLARVREADYERIGREIEDHQTRKLIS